MGFFPPSFVRYVWVPLACCMAVSACASRPPTEGVPVVPLAVSNGNFQVFKAVSSWKAIRDRNVVMQGFDYSCGAAALATLMRYYFGDKVNEAGVLADMLAHVPPAQMAKVKREGFSLLDLKQFAERRGYRAAGVRIDLADLPRLRGPILVYLELVTSRHFAVVRGVREDRVYLADPARGNLILRVDRFESEWPSRITLVLGKPGFVAPAHTPLSIDTQGPFRTELQSAREAIYAQPPRQ